MLTGYPTWMPTHPTKTSGMTSRAPISTDVLHPPVRFHRRARCWPDASRINWVACTAWRMAMQGFGLLVAVPFIVPMGNSSTLWVIYIGFAGFGLPVRSSTPTPSVFHDVIPPRYHRLPGVMIMTDSPSARRPAGAGHGEAGRGAVAPASRWPSWCAAVMLPRCQIFKARL